MKIKPDDMAVLRQRMEKVVNSLPGIADRYKAADRSHKWYRWDILRATNLKIGDGAGAPGDLNLYAYMNDDHIDTALRAILGSDY